MKKYYPILLSKKGEIVALQYLTQQNKEIITPVIELLDDSIEKKVKEGDSFKIVYRDEFENFLKTHWSFFGNEIILDFSLITDIENKVVVIKKMILSLVNAGVNVILAFQNRIDLAYCEMAKKIATESNLNVCWRTSENSGGFDNFNMLAEKFLQYIDFPPERIIILIDLGYAKYDRYNTLRDMAKTAIISMTTNIEKWNCVVVASSSCPENLGEFKTQKEPHRISRNEWEIWKGLISDDRLVQVKYGDFGTKFPFYVKADFAGTVSIKYTTETEFIFYKGKLTNEHKDGHGQYITHANQLISSDAYSGRDFSWGDMKIWEIGNEDLGNEKRKTGSSTTWVQISQNHHIAIICSLL